MKSFSCWVLTLLTFIVVFSKGEAIFGEQLGVGQGIPVRPGLPGLPGLPGGLLGLAPGLVDPVFKLMLIGGDLFSNLGGDSCKSGDCSFAEKENVLTYSIRDTTPMTFP